MRAFEHQHEYGNLRHDDNTAMTEEEQMALAMIRSEADGPPEPAPAPAPADRKSVV